LTMVSEFAESCCGFVSQRGLSSIIQNGETMTKYLKENSDVWAAAHKELMRQHTNTVKIENFVTRQLQLVKHDMVTSFAEVKTVQEMVTKIMLALDHYNTIIKTVEVTQLWNIRNLTS